MGTKWDIEKFIEDNNFGDWKLKVQVGLIQQKCVEAMKGELVLSTTLSQSDKIKIVDKARSVLVLCLRDKVLREGVKEIIVGGVLLGRGRKLSISTLKQRLLQVDLHVEVMVVWRDVKHSTSS
ncbi:hypothetical protein MTR_3g069560 [Medicago truncatula]|uniref:Uncharacterized protein n=1 Tax=Medicago truncatula TaxID=3880 RepID=G7JA32_MEDTR|nr:hypothetical protein MTR_3g069560 [Medicago truncatula]